jgi:hypothetical protein
MDDDVEEAADAQADDGRNNQRHRRIEKELRHQALCTAWPCAVTPPRRA